MKALPKDSRALSRVFRLIATLAAGPALVAGVACSGTGHLGPDDYRCSPQSSVFDARTACLSDEEARMQWSGQAPEVHEYIKTNLSQAGLFDAGTGADPFGDAGADGGADSVMPDFGSCEVRCRAFSNGERYENHCVVETANASCQLHCRYEEFHPCGRRPAGYAGPRGIRSKSLAGQYLAGCAALEAASVDAFEFFAQELQEHGAPHDLVAIAKKSAEDERRHTRATRRLAKRFGGDYQAPNVRRRRARSLRAMARENVVEGCVREAYGALVATYQAMNARDEKVRQAMKVIAAEETAHAALAFHIAEWAEAKLDEKERRHIEAARRKAVRKLFEAAAAPVDKELAHVLGLPSPDVAAKLLAGFFGAQMSPTH